MDEAKALFRVRYSDWEYDGTVTEVVVDNMTQVRNMEEIHRVLSVEVAVPVWAPLKGY